MSSTSRPGQPPDLAARLTLSSYQDFYRHWMPQLKRFVMTQTSDRRWVEDIAQDAMLAAGEKWDELITYDKPGAWLFRVAVIMLRRTQAKAREQCTSLDDVVTRGDHPTLTARGFDEWVDNHMDLTAAIQTLPRRQREVIVLHSILGHPLADTAEIMGISEGSAKTHLYRARKKLTDILNPASPPAAVDAKRLS